MAQKKLLITALLFLNFCNFSSSLAQGFVVPTQSNPNNLNSSVISSQPQLLNSANPWENNQNLAINNPTNSEEQKANSDNCKIDEDIRNAIIARIKADPNNYFKNLAPCYRQDRKLLIKLAINNINQLKFTDENLKSDENFFLRLTKINSESLQYADKSLLSDEFFMERATYISRESLKYADKKLLDNKIFMKKMINLDSKNYIFASERLKKNHEISASAFSDDGSLLLFAPEEVKSDKNLVKIAVKNDVSSLQFATKEVREDKDFKKIKIPQFQEYLEELQSFVKENYVNQKNASDYDSEKFINKAKFAKKNKIIDRDFITKWQFPKLSPNEIQLSNYEKRNFPAQWKKDLKKYPSLIKKIEQFFAKRGVDKNSIEELSLTYFWKVNNKPLTLAFNLYSLRDNPDFDLGLSFSDVTSLTAIAYQKNNDWELSVVETILDKEVETNVEFRNGHKKFYLWDIVAKSKKESSPKIIYKVEEKLEDYLEVYGQKSLGKYELILRYKY